MIGRKTRVLYVFNDHPSLHPGGAEIYAHELYQALRDTDEFEPFLVARIGSEDGVERNHRPGAALGSFDGRPDQYVVSMDQGGFDFFLMTFRDTSLYTRYFGDFLRSLRPDVVHFQDSLFMGCELISLVHYLLPTAAIVHTLHDYTPICHRDGTFVRTRSPATSEAREELCLEASPRRCHECFPGISEQDFYLRKRFIQAHLDHVDLFLAPSHFLRERYVEWGIAPERIRFEDYGRLPVRRLPETEDSRPRDRLGFFGQLSPYKGIEVLLEAMRILRDEQPGAHLRIHGSNAWRYSQDHQRRLWSALEEVDGNVTFAGSYDRDGQAKRMSSVDWVVVPSRWWGNSPLVVQEAFLHHRPVICSGIGGMAEKVIDGTNGLHFDVGDARSLADTIRRAVDTPGLWDELRKGIPSVPGMEDHVANVSTIYRELLDRKRRVETPLLSHT